MSAHVVTCQGCGAAIVFIRTAAGRQIPVDASPAAIEWRRVQKLFEPGNADLVSHFATCPKAKRFRKRRKN